MLIAPIQQCQTFLLSFCGSCIPPLYRAFYTGLILSCDSSRGASNVHRLSMSFRALNKIIW